MNDEATGRADHDENTTDFGFTRVDREAKDDPPQDEREEE